eukprot:2285897-Pleurochrysis_carterae.AAC.1
MALHDASLSSWSGKTALCSNVCTSFCTKKPGPAVMRVCKPAVTEVTWFTTAAHVGKFTVEG